MKELVLCAETATDIEKEMLDFIDGLGVPKTKVVCPPRLVYFYYNNERENVWAMTLKDKKRRSYHIFLYLDRGVMTIEVGFFSFTPIPAGTTLPNGICGLRGTMRAENWSRFYIAVAKSVLPSSLKMTIIAWRRTARNIKIKLPNRPDSFKTNKKPWINQGFFLTNCHGFWSRMAYIVRLRRNIFQKIPVPALESASRRC